MREKGFSRISLCIHFINVFRVDSCAIHHQSRFKIIRLYFNENLVKCQLDVQEALTFQSKTSISVLAKQLFGARLLRTSTFWRQLFVALRNSSLVHISAAQRLGEFIKKKNGN